MPPTIRTTTKPFVLTLATAAAGISLLTAAPVPAARAQSGDDLIEAAKKQLDKYQKKAKAQEEQERQITAALAKQGEVLGRAEAMLRAQAEATKRSEAATARQEELIARQNRLIEQQQRQLEQAQRMIDGLRARFGGGGPPPPAGTTPPPPVPNAGSPAPERPPLIPPTPPVSPMPAAPPAAPPAPPRDAGTPPPTPLPTPNAAETPKSPM